MSLFFTGATIVDCGKMNDFVLTEGGAFSMSCWVYPLGYGGAAQGRFLERGLSTFLNFQDTGALRFQVFSASGSTMRHDAITGSVSLNRWSHISVVWLGSTVANQSFIYVNGQETPYTREDNGSFLRDNAGDIVYLGNTPNGLIRSFHGHISNFACWNGVLTTNEINQLYNGGQSRTPLEIQKDKLQFFAPMDGFGQNQVLNSMDRIIDYSRYGNHGTPSGNVQGGKAESIHSYPG